MKKKLTSLAASIVLVGSLNAAIVAGQTIGVDIGNADGTTPNWTLVTAFNTSVNASDLSDGSAISGVSLLFNSSTGNIFINDLSNTADTNNLLNAPQNVLTDGGGAFAGGLNTITLNFNGLDDSLTYNLEIFSLGTGTTTDSISINGSAADWGTAFDTRNERRLADQGIVFSGQSTNGSGQLSFAISHNNNPVLNAVRLTAVPEPSSAILFGLGGLALILRRSK